MDNVQISAMTFEDLELIKDILFTDFDDFWNYSTFKSELENLNSKYIVAKIENKIIGFAGIWKAVDIIHITNIVTLKNLRNHGIGSLMLEKLIELAKKDKNITSITLEVNSNNIPAQKLYQKFGFKTVGLRKKYYNNKDDALLMSKQLHMMKGDLLIML